MKQALQENTEITLCETGTDKRFCFRVINIIGMGAGSIVYTASYTDSEGNDFTVRLKECYPAGLEITRSSAMELVVPDKFNDAFEKYKQRFTDGYRRQLKFRQNPKSMNSISNIQGIFEGNNTKYIAMSCQNGISIDEAELSLYDIFRVLKAVTVQIDNFHKNNFLYLDLKPENVILYPETPELVMLFDFDSAVEIHELDRENLSFTEKWSAPETVQKKTKNIGVRSDIYTLGALLMYMLLGRNPELTDRRRNADWTDEFQNSLLAYESPETKRMAADIFRKTLSANPAIRAAVTTHAANWWKLLNRLYSRSSSRNRTLKQFCPLAIIISADVTGKFQKYIIFCGQKPVFSFCMG
ncbi:MAG: protein kinase [Porcipelethomonas sp.]